MQLLITCVGVEAPVRTYIRKTKWNRTEASIFDPFSSCLMSVCYLLNSRSYFCFPKTVNAAMERKHTFFGCIRTWMSSYSIHGVP